MKLFVKRVECKNQTFRKKDKSGDFTIDTTLLITDVPKQSNKFNLNGEEGKRGTISYGMDEMAYQVGLTPTYQNFFKLNLDKLQNLLPCELEVELGQGHDGFERPCTVITAVKIPQTGKPS